VDFAYLRDSDRVKVIEISPFLRCTGPSLFSWVFDREIMENGPFEFRIKDAPYPNIDPIVETNWEARWRGEVLKYDEFYHFVEPSNSFPVSLPTMLYISSFTSVGLISFLYPYYSKSQSFALLSLYSVLCVIAASTTSVSFKMLYQHWKPKTHNLFVYGTLKRGFHWNSKFLGGPTTRYIGKATTVNKYPLVIGDCGVPYLLGDLNPEKTGNMILGEVYSVDDSTLKNLDEYEGVSKLYYDRKEIRVFVPALCRSTRAFVYFKRESSDALKNSPFLKEYSLEFHQENYKAITHILVKQQIYFKEPLNRD